MSDTGTGAVALPRPPSLTLGVVEFRILSAGWRPTFAASRHNLATSPEKA